MNVKRQGCSVGILGVVALSLLAGASLAASHHRHHRSHDGRFNQRVIWNAAPPPHGRRHGGTPGGPAHGPRAFPLDAVRTAPGPNPVLVLYDTTGPYGHLGELYAMGTVNLVSHF